MTNKLTITVPVPPRELHPNGRAHWAKKARATKAARAQGDAAAVLAMSDRMNRPLPDWKSATIRATFYVKDRRGLKQDGDNANASLKAYADGIADAGVIVNDRGFIWHQPRFVIDAKEPRVEIIVEEVATDGE